MPATLPGDSTEGETLFEVVRIDYGGPINYKTRKNGEGMAHILLIAFLEN